MRASTRFARCSASRRTESFSFSDAPLRLALWGGAAVSGLAFLYGLSVIGRWVFGDPSLERGWSSTIVIVAALGGANMLMTGVIGLYVGRIYAEAKGRPLYIVERAIGLGDASPTSARRAQRRAQEREAKSRGEAGKGLSVNKGEITAAQGLGVT